VILRHAGFKGDTPGLFQNAFACQRLRTFDKKQRSDSQEKPRDCRYYEIPANDSGFFVVEATDRSAVHRLSLFTIIYAETHS